MIRGTYQAEKRSIMEVYGSRTPMAQRIGSDLLSQSLNRSRSAIDEGNGELPNTADPENYRQWISNWFLEHRHLFYKMDSGSYDEGWELAAAVEAAQTRTEIYVAAPDLVLVRDAFLEIKEAERDLLKSTGRSSARGWAVGQSGK